MSNPTRDTQVETDQFSREITGLPEAQPPETIELGLYGNIIVVPTEPEWRPATM
jgi:hypothetical protein